MKKLFSMVALVTITMVLLAGCGSSNGMTTAKGKSLDDATVISFDTTDMDGNKVNSKDLFGGHKVTMINVWATWCDPCKEELGELDEINKELEGMNCQVVGVCIDTCNDASVVSKANEILAANGATYTNLVATQEMYDALNSSMMPVSYFVDSEGRLLLEPLKGAAPDKYVAKVEEALSITGK